jgi:predicted RNA-binding Zn-ribbon protein involved in translation (DUF1610 family)/glutathione S-transferase
MSATFRVADVIRSCWESYNRAHRLPPHVVRAVGHILRCRTAALGGHLYRCDRCGRELPMYNSCQTRHCPTCQTAAKEEWLDQRLAEVLPVQYFHVVFTLPHSLHALVDANRTLLFGDLFGTVNWVLQHFARDPRWRLEGQLGFLAILHTWTQRLKRHFHLHCLVPGGVWRPASKEWVSCRGQWLFRKDSLADAFRNRFLHRLRSMRRRGTLAYRGHAAALAADRVWEALLTKLAAQTWVVYPKPTPADPALALDYLARYTHKVAISDHRIRAIKGGRVTYTWRDRSHGNIEKTETLPVEVFTSRFLAHILPDGFHKIRYFGWMAAVNRKTILAAIRAALGALPSAVKSSRQRARTAESLAERILQRTGVDITLCPHCGQGHLRRTQRLLLPIRCNSP